MHSVVQLCEFKLPHWCNSRIVVKPNFLLFFGLFVQFMESEICFGCLLNSTERMDALSEVSRGEQHPLAPRQHLLPWSSATGWFRLYRYQLFRVFFVSAIYLYLGLFFFFTDVLLRHCLVMVCICGASLHNFKCVYFCYRPQQRWCMTSFRPLHRWTASLSQKAEPPPVGHAELLSLLTSEKEWQRPMTPSERWHPNSLSMDRQIHSYTHTSFNGHCRCRLYFCFTVLLSGSDWHSSDPVRCSISRPWTKGSSWCSGRCPPADPTYCGPSFDRGLWSHL